MDVYSDSDVSRRVKNKLCRLFALRVVRSACIPDMFSIVTIALRGWDEVKQAGCKC